MKARWLVAKFMSDIRRREPVNIGVVLDVDGSLQSKFRAEVKGGRIDGRRVPVGADHENYRAWIDYWKYLMGKQSVDLDYMATSKSDENYYLEPSGELIQATPGRTPAELLEYLYSVLVSEGEREDSLPVRRQSERVLKRVGVWDRVSEDFVVNLGRTTDALRDYTRFDYKFENGMINLMRALTLSDREESLHLVHGAKYEFEAVKQMRKYRDSNFVSFVSMRGTGEKIQIQRAILSQKSRVIDVSNEESAQAEVSDALHLS